MNLILGTIIIPLSMLAWVGQLVTTFAPKLAARLSLSEDEADVDPAIWADIRGEAVWDSLILWTLPAAGFLLVLNSDGWPYLGLVGGGVFLYFSGRGISSRLAMRKRRIRVGKPETEKVFYIFLTLWGLIGLTIIILAASALRS
jgi:hypothetical protein